VLTADLKKSAGGYMTTERRAQRVEKELQHLVANYLIRGLKVRLPGLVTVSRVMVGEKIRTAKIFVSILGSDAEIERALELLDEYTHDVQKHVSKELRMKFIPRVSFEIDKGLEHYLKVESALHKIAQERSELEKSRKGEEE
jgi:ribosome-binding factor A